MKRPKWTYWRRWLWIYRSAAGGWCIYLFGRGWHFTSLENEYRDYPDSYFNNLVIETLKNNPQVISDNVVANNALMRKLRNR